MTDIPLAQDLEFWRAERPDGWTMDHFINAAKKMELEIAQLKSELDDLKSEINPVMWFCLDSEGDYHEYPTQKEALDAASDDIRDCLHCGGWEEEVENIVVGCITHRSTQCNLKTRPPEEELDEEGCDGEGHYWGDYDAHCSYEMLPCPPKVDTK